jgi:hypothetical protein
VAQDPSLDNGFDKLGPQRPREVEDGGNIEGCPGTKGIDDGRDETLPYFLEFGVVEVAWPIWFDGGVVVDGFGGVEGEDSDELRFCVGWEMDC